MRIPVRAVLGFVVVVVLLPLVLFPAAGRLDWAEAWAFVGIHLGMTFLSRFVVWRTHPALLAERGRFSEKGMAQGRDRLLLLWAAILGPLVTWIVAGLDERLSWSPDLPAALQAAAGVVMLVGYALGAWAMAVNAFFSAVVRIQGERGQKVITGGPYRWVRHPGYAGGILAYLAMPLLLDSLWALIPAAAASAVVVIRTALEDGTLHDGLDGYVEYAKRTRYRLLPGVW